MKKLRYLIAIAAGGAALACPTVAGASGAVWAFGDSLSDNGNIARILPGYSNGPGYAGARFSNGPVYVEYLPPLLHQAFVAGNDKAVGGAFAGTGNLVGTFLPGTATEIADFARAGQRFGPADTILLLAGANDYFGVLAKSGGGPVDVAAQSARVTGDIVADAERLASLGARRLVVLNIPDLSVTERYLGNPTAAALTEGTNAALAGRLAPLATGGRSVYLVDLSTLVHEAVANPARFGLSDVTHACALTPACLASDRDTQDRNLFWDSVHPNTWVHETIARVVANQIAAADAIGMQGQVAILAAQGFNDRLLARQGRDTPIPGYRVSFFLEADQQSGRFAGRDGQYGFGNDIVASTAGMTYRLADHASIGAAFGYSRAQAGASDLDGSRDAASYRVDGYHLGMFGHVDRAGFFADIAGSYAFLTDAKGSRPGLLEGERIDGAPNGGAGTVGAAIGYRLHDGPFRFGPVARLGYARVDLDHYGETGEPVLTQSVRAQRLDSLIGHAGLEADTSIPTRLGQLRPRVSIAVAREFLDGSRQLHTRFLSAGLPLTTAMPGYTATFGLAGAGIALATAHGGLLDLGFDSSFARRGVVQREVLLRGRIAF